MYVSVCVCVCVFVCTCSGMYVCLCMWNTELSFIYPSAFTMQLLFFNKNHLYMYMMLSISASLGGLVISLEEHYVAKETFVNFGSFLATIKL